MPLVCKLPAVALHEFAPKRHDDYATNALPPYRHHHQNQNLTQLPPNLEKSIYKRIGVASNRHDDDDDDAANPLPLHLPKSATPNKKTKSAESPPLPPPHPRQLPEHRAASTRHPLSLLYHPLRRNLPKLQPLLPRRNLPLKLHPLPRHVQKTPSRTPIRPSSRSSHLYAPTAASLARARNAPEPVPTPPKKTLSVGASERLSKPTAASLSRARTPVASPPSSKSAAPPPRSTPTPKPATRGHVGAGARGGKVPATPLKTTPVKKAPSSTSSKASKSPEAASSNNAVVSGAAATVAADQDVFTTKEAEAEPQTEDVPAPTPESSQESEAQPEPSEELEDSVVHESEIKVVVSDEGNGDVAVTHEDDVALEETKEEVEPEVPHTNGSATTDSSITDTAEPQESEPEPEQEQEASNSDNGVDSDPISDKLAALASKHDGNVVADIEHMVNFLETVPQPTSVGAVTPSELQEIPDEDH
ncbi:hypothetical protein NP233_g3973 [Leucocoprinus birnbaumii]|uniref:Uncharacterized protein n=1 Tax=Leucocoprinus birnbaumii TaxID=56174 RepID=A0AAD5VVK8_9AGAR|nr:hypothetical protein NP233_g3973 [Leucocoprinus birnbaumii]